MIDFKAMPRMNMSVEIDPSLQKSIKEACVKTGLNQKALVSLVLRWFALQDPDTQALVVSPLTEGTRRALLRSIMQKEAGEGEGTVQSTGLPQHREVALATPDRSHAPGGEVAATATNEDQPK